jgi:DNA-binding transcriptional MocR family regulator
MTMRRTREEKTLGFRLTGRPRAELERQAEALGCSPGELCRAVIERYLKHDESRAILEALDALARRHEALAKALEEALSSLEEELARLRHDFNRAVKG